MGKVKLDAQQSQNTINHFSHPHPLEHTTHQNFASLCAGCKNQATGSIYTCKICNFFLHPECSQMPQKITHPFDKEHPFILLPKPIYPEGNFNCDACGKTGDGFSYHCKTCGTDLHMLCAVFPLCVTHWSHHHQLELKFSPPYPDKSFCCDICKKTGNDHWLYRCQICGFDAHLNCTKLQVQPHQSHVHHNPTISTNTRSPPQAQHQPSGIGQQHSTGLNHMNQGINNGAGVPPFGANMQNNEMSYHEILRKQSEEQQKMIQEMILAATARQNQAISQLMATSARQNQDINQQLMQTIQNASAGGGQGGVPNLYQNMMGGAGGGGGVNNILQALSGGGSGGSGGMEMIQSLMGGGTGGLGGLDLSSLFGGLSF